MGTNAPWHEDRLTLWTVAPALASTGTHTLLAIMHLPVLQRHLSTVLKPVPAKKSCRIRCPSRPLLWPPMASSSIEAQSAETLTAAEKEKGMQLVKQLEQQAMEAHTKAQELNKQGKYEEAQATYAEMRRLDAAALDATQALGCPSCRDAAAAASRSQSQQADDIHKLYEQLHKPTAWPSQSLAGPLSISKRAVGAIIGCCVADAAAMPVQWIYDTSILDKLLGQRQQQATGAAAEDVGLEFYDPVQSSFLPQYKTGRNSPYGEQTVLLLESLASQGGLHCGSYAELYGASYRAEGFQGYMNASTVAFLRNSSRGLRPPATGADDQQADCVARLAPLVAMFAGDDRLMSLVEAATRVTQNTDAAVAWGCAGAAVLERLLQGQGAAAAVQETVQELQQQGRMPGSQLGATIGGHLERTLALQQQPHAAAVQALGRNCHMPNALQTPLHTVLHQEWLVQQQKQQQADASAASLFSLSKQEKQQLFMAGIRDALAAGGCCASRASYAGACLGALLGPDAVPDSWLQRYDAAGKVEEWAKHISAARSS